MKRGFYIIIAAQFFSSLADNALLIAAIALLMELKSPDWMTPLLKLFFYISYVLLAPFVGAFADSMPKGKVMMIANLIKMVGCFMMFLSIHPLLSYAVVGFGAAAYSPAKYGILTELLPAEQLVIANGWIEGSTVCSIILGVVIGGILIQPPMAHILLSFDLPMVDTGVNTPAEAAISVIAVSYLVAAVINLRIPLTHAHYAPQAHTPAKLLTDFGHCFMVLWRDKQGQISLSVTTLFWGAGATLQFIVLKWAESALGMPLGKAAMLQGAVAVGVAFGAVAAARFITLKNSFSVLKMGIFMGIVVMLMTLVHTRWLAYAMLILIGILSGYFVVPMNAMLQHRGHVLMSSGHSIAVQNFNENLSVLTMLGIYALMISTDMPMNAVIVMFGAFVSLTMWMVIKQHAMNQRQAAIT
jgi:LPLT family lysophospholipid transporter-like MFS transporter